MLISLEEKVKDLDGKIVRDGEEELTIAKVCRVACQRCGVGPDGRPVDATSQVRRWKIAKRVMKGEIEPEDVEEIKTCVAALYANPMFTGVVSEYLHTVALMEKDESKKSKKESES